MQIVSRELWCLRKEAMRTIIEAYDTIAEGQGGIGIKEKLLIQNDMTAASSGQVHNFDWNVAQTHHECD